MYMLCRILIDEISLGTVTSVNYRELIYFLFYSFHRKSFFELPYRILGNLIVSYGSLKYASHHRIFLY